MKLIHKVDDGLQKDVEVLVLLESTYRHFDFSS